MSKDERCKKSVSQDSQMVDESVEIEEKISKKMSEERVN